MSLKKYSVVSSGIITLFENKMAESKAMIEFKVKKGIFEKIAKKVICEICKIVPREVPIYVSSKQAVVCSTCKGGVQKLRHFAKIQIELKK